METKAVKSVMPEEKKEMNLGRTKYGSLGRRLNVMLVIMMLLMTGVTLVVAYFALRDRILQ